MSDENQQKVSKTKGRPMLHWVGKKPIDVVQSYPAQLVETVGKSNNSAPNYELLMDDWQNLLFHGDNKEVLSTLIVNGFRGKIDLIYIDPPFDSGADYVRKVELRGSKDKLDGEDKSVLEQTQYTDIWANDNYLQFMYERLILMRELLSEDGAIYLHCDYRKVHHLRMIMDEIFGDENQIGQLVWEFSTRSTNKSTWKRSHNDILFYKKANNPIFNWKDPMVLEELSDSTKEKYRYVDEIGKYRLSGRNITGSPIRSAKDVDPKYEETNPEWVVRDYLRDGKVPNDFFFINIENQASNTRTGYPTQKPEELLYRLISASTKPGALVLDCFVGSGTTSSVAQKLGRRWIGVDVNKGAIQTTMKRIQKVITEQTKANKLIDENKPASNSVLHFRVNNYDFQKQHELKGIIVEKYDVTPVKTDSYFDGTVGDRLVKIAELNQPVNKLTIQGVLNELKNRSNDTRDILIVGSGVELGVDSMLADYNKTHAVNKLEVKNIQSDGIIVNDPAEADVIITKKDNKLTVLVNDYLSPTIVKRLEIDRSIFGEKIGDFRAQIDVVLIDSDYDGKTFNIRYADVPEKKSDLVLGKYELELPKSSKKVAVKIIDMLGEETLTLG